MLNSSRYLYYKVGNTTVNADLINIDEITTALAQKADIDGSNVVFNNLSSTAKENIRLRAVPDYNSGITVTIGSNYEWTAPASGIIIAIGNTNQYALGVFADQTKQIRLWGQNNSSNTTYISSSFIVQAGVTYYFDLYATVPVFYPFL